MSQPLVFEIGVEELPASFVAGALAAMPAIARDLFARARLEHGAIRCVGTPRRLTLLVDGLADAQRDLSETVLGPPKAAAYEADGTPKKAALGFAKKLGLPVDALRIEETDKGAYVAGRREERGQPAAEVLPALLAELARALPFPKSMRWGAGEVAFGRPVHWLLCLHGEREVDVEFAGARAGRESRGHRFLAPAPFALPHADRYVDALREAHVLVDEEERQRVMRERLEVAAAAAGGEVVEDAFLIGENASLVEEPHVICGAFDPDYLTLPDDVIIEVMRGHQRYFALRSPEGVLLPRYLAVVNTALAPEVIVKGNDRVLRARLADARFFVETDRAHGLESRVAQLEQVVFQAKLGSVGERVKRFAEIVRALGDEGPAAEAARLCKADLVTLIVGEFPELQGSMGRFYALQEGVPGEVADALRDHYLPRGAGDAVPSAIPSARLAVADRADALVGCFGLGLVPSGSADPFALRRAALGVVRIALEGPIDVDLRATLEAAHAAYRAQDKPVGDEAKVLALLDEFFRGRLAAFHGERYPTDVVAACLGAWGGHSIRDLSARLAALEVFRRLPAYESLAVAFKRAYNITKDLPADVAGEPDLALMTEPAERALAERFASLAPTLREATERGEYERALTLIATELREPIDTFFDEVFVMVDDADVRNNRLRLLHGIAQTLTAIAHFHLLGAQTAEG